ncbi:MAG: hypothetical protein FGM55_02365 [Rhodoferax sp.]|nr:hypothetical protein [Rhodoferax sp.]
MASLRQITLVVYALYALSWVTGITALVAIIINYVKRDDARGTLYESHFTWQIRTFWWSLAWTLLGVLTMFILVGFLIMGITAVWSIYRLVRGWLNWNDHKPMPVST